MASGGSSRASVTGGGSMTSWAGFDRSGSFLGSFTQLSCQSSLSARNEQQIAENASVCSFSPPPASGLGQTRTGSPGDIVPKCFPFRGKQTSRTTDRSVNNMQPPAHFSTCFACHPSGECPLAGPIFASADSGGEGWPTHGRPGRGPAQGGRAIARTVHGSPAPAQIVVLLPYPGSDVVPQRGHTMRKHFPLATALALATLISAPGARAQRGAPAGPQRTSTPPPLRFYYMGPATGGRIASVVGVPGDASIYYLGNASGGLYKTTDGAKTFVPVFDDQDVAAIGTLALAPSDPNTVWVGTGEPWVIRASDVEGDGVYKSADAGATWQHMGLEDSGRIARILVNPTNPNIVWVCSEGHLTGEGQKGVYRSDDGGANWKRVLYVDPRTSCSGLALDPQHPDTMLAGMWTVEEHTWAELSGGSGSGVYASHDGGLTWSRLAQGLPHAPVGKVEVAIAPSNGQRMYALMQTADQGSLWRSDDGGASWQVASWDRSLIGRAGYYFRMAVNPQNPDEVLISSSGFHRSLDGGHLFSGGGGFGGNGPRQASCGDCHDIWMDPKIPGRYALTEDGGSSISTGTGEVLSVSPPNGQMYHVASDNRVPYWLYSNRQDNGTWRGPSTVSEAIGNARMPADTFMPSAGGGAGRGRGRAAAAPPAEAPSANGLVGGPAGGAAGGRGRGGADALAWQSGIGGCESGFTVPDPTDADIVWASCYGNKLTRYDAREGEAHSVEPWMISLDSPPNEAKYRCHWTAPVAIDPFNHNIVYYGCQ